MGPVIGILFSTLSAATVLGFPLSGIVVDELEMAPGSAISAYDPNVGTDGTPVPFPVNAILNKDQFWDIVDPACP